MQMTYKATADSLTGSLLDAIKNRFGKKEVEIIIKEVVEEKPVSQMEVFQNMEKLRAKLKKVKVDPDLDLSALANEVNL